MFVFCPGHQEMRRTFQDALPRSVQYSVFAAKAEDRKLSLSSSVTRLMDTYPILLGSLPLTPL